MQTEKQLDRIKYMTAYRAFVNVNKVLDLYSISLQKNCYALRTKASNKNESIQRRFTKRRPMVRPAAKPRGMGSNPPLVSSTTTLRRRMMI